MCVDEIRLWKHYRSNQLGEFGKNECRGSVIKAESTKYVYRFLMNKLKDNKCSLLHALLVHPPKFDLWARAPTGDDEFQILCTRIRGPGQLAAGQYVGQWAVLVLFVLRGLSSSVVESVRLE